MSANLPVLAEAQTKHFEPDWVPVSERPIVGKDVLELLSSSMYVNPLAIYREYIQNAADAIDEARLTGQLKEGHAGRIDLQIDHSKRTVRIRDNGTGLDPQQFVPRMIAFGSSKKRGSRARGFRGVGRLAGLGYCKELIFRSRTSSDQSVCEVRWDCRGLKAALRKGEFSGSIEELVGAIVTSRSIRAKDFPSRCFEVELREIVRHGNDVLVNKDVVESYLSQVAPVPFAPAFKSGERITAKLKSHVELGNVEIYVNGSDKPLYRPHTREFEVRKGITDSFGEPEFLEYKGVDDRVAAVGWILDHGYEGALPPSTGMKGLRLRCGNMQIGESNLLDDIFIEPRFNSWVVGEIHIVDERILPNGRRDYFEQGAHFKDLLGKLRPLAERLSRHCRASSVRRNWIRQFEQGITYLNERAAILTQAAVTRAKRNEIKEQMEDRIAKIEKIAALSIIGLELQKQFQDKIKETKSKIHRLLQSRGEHKKLASLKKNEREIVEKVFDLIYTIAGNEASTKVLIQKILRRL